MAVKLTIQGGLIYLTMLFFIATLVAARLRRNQNATAFWIGGFTVALLSVAWRGFSTGHPPMQNLFEFFLCMAAALAPLSWWNLRRHGLDTKFQDAVIGLVILFPAGFVFKEEMRHLMPALQSPFFVPHVAAYVAGYVMMTRATAIALPMFRRDTAAERLARIDLAVRQSVAAGFVLITAGLLLGSIWGKVCWSNYWAWDPKEMWSLATWLVYAAYFHFRQRYGVSRPRSLAVLLCVGLLFIVLTLTWINLSRIFSGMHTYA
ncbi:MAG: cytochrome c biogenesis protein CcsA [Kiritimatiellae bacterium]|nr:cytochrome c biogenesis protein CcsA [Kiritimatiellia bacterium]